MGYLIVLAKCSSHREGEMPQTGKQRDHIVVIWVKHGHNAGRQRGGDHNIVVWVKLSTRRRSKGYHVAVVWVKAGHNVGSNGEAFLQASVGFSVVCL